MHPGEQIAVPPIDCVFPWTIPNEPNLKPDAAPREHADDEEHPADEKPIAYRAWCVEHAEELGEA